MKEELFMPKNKKSIGRRIAMDAVLIALYVAMSMLAFTLGGFKLTFEHLPVIICAVLFGPVDAMLVGGLGEFINQMLTFGFTPTTLLWMTPAIFCGLATGLGARLAGNHLGLNALLNRKTPVAFYALCVGVALCCSGLNTFTLYVDSKMFGYYSYAMVFGILWLRLGAGAVSSVLMALVTKPVVTALKKSKMI